MIDTVKIGIVCDVHLTDRKESPQYAFLKLAAEQMKKDGIHTVICLGDITSRGNVAAWWLYRELFSEFEHYEVVGNWDAKNPATRETIMRLAKRPVLSIGGRKLIGIHTPDGKIEQQDRDLLKMLKPGDILVMHHNIHTLEQKSGHWLLKLAIRVPITILHGHRHWDLFEKIGSSRVFGMRGLDPDKAVGGFPAINYLTISEGDVTLQTTPFPLPKAYLEDTARFFGLSCVDNQLDISYATEHNVKYVELRCNGTQWKPDMTLLPALEAWRKKTDGYLSIHMPNLHYMDGQLCGQEQWMAALEYAVALKADSLTIHPPRASISAMENGGPVWKQFLELYVAAAKAVPASMKIGIENLHRRNGEPLDETRGFGYLPEEVSSWIDAINEALGECRVGHVLDVGHAQINGTFAGLYPLSTWYQSMGQKTVAYHIHQVIANDVKTVDHSAIENWFGPKINYTGFFYAWHVGILKHAPVFLEVKGHKNFEKSIAAFQKMLEEVAV